MRTEVASSVFGRVASRSASLATFEGPAAPKERRNRPGAASSGLVERSKAPSSVFGSVASMKVAPSRPLGALRGAFLGALGALLGSPGGLLGRSWRGFAAPRSRRERKSRKYGFRYTSAAKTLLSTSRRLRKYAENHLRRRFGEPESESNDPGGSCREVPSEKVPPEGPSGASGTGGTRGPQVRSSPKVMYIPRDLISSSLSIDPLPSPY